MLLFCLLEFGIFRIKYKLFLYKILPEFIGVYFSDGILSILFFSLFSFNNNDIFGDLLALDDKGGIIFLV